MKNADAKFRAGIPLMLISLLLAGCSLLSGLRQDPVACTLMGCLSTLDVNMYGLPADAFTFHITLPDETEFTQECANGEPSEFAGSGEIRCRTGGVTVVGISPDEAIVTISWEGGVMESEIFPVYEQFQPNGPDCPPICLTGSAAVTVAP